MRKRIVTVLGTRPEVIKLAPVLRELLARPEFFESVLVSTGQHREMVDQALEGFGLRIDVQLDAMTAAQSLGSLTGRLFTDLDAVLAEARPDWVLVQGDTTSAMVGAMCAFYRRMRVGHVEAGLRTHDRWSPFPEEVNRTMISRVADLHFAPTVRASENLVNEGVSAGSVHVTGNTVVDALLWISGQLGNEAPEEIGTDLLRSIEGKRLLLVTSHRRESFGKGLEDICQAVLELVSAYPDVAVVYPVHLNPNVRGPVRKLLGGCGRIHLMDPLGYRALVYLLRRSYCVLTDSGGIQEEAPSFGKPVVIMRETTERAEVIDAGCGCLTGTGTANIVGAVSRLLIDADRYKQMAGASNPFGDGKAALRIARHLATHGGVEACEP